MSTTIDNPEKLTNITNIDTADSWYTSGLSAGERCEKLLSSNEWQRCSTKTLDGLNKRFELMESTGLSRMKVISLTTIETLGRIPRSNEGYAVDGQTCINNYGAEPFSNKPNAIIVFFSHRWLRPNWCPGLKKDLIWGTTERAAAAYEGCFIGDVDDEDHSKAKALIQWAKWFKEYRKQLYSVFGDIALNITEIFFWIDWPCVDQMNPGMHSSIA